MGKLNRAKAQAKEVSALKDALRKAGLDGALIRHLPNIRYLFHFTGSTALALVTLDRFYLMVDSRYRLQASEETRFCNLVSRNGVTNEEALVELIKRKKLRKLGFESRYLSVSHYGFLRRELPGSVKLKPSDHLVEDLRIIKTPGEIAKIRQVVELTANVFDSMIPLVKPGISERDLAVELEHRLIQRGAEQVSFRTIVASGFRSAMPHGIASDKIVRQHELIVFDFGAMKDGYCSDMTRTLFVGRPSREVRRIYDTVLHAQTHTEQQLKPGMKAKEVDRLARSIIEKGGYGDRFGHGTGHGIGLEVHEPPFIGRRQESVLEKGMVITVEPGIYLPGTGGVRIEDVVVVTEGGCQVLTPSPKDFLAV